MVGPLYLKDALLQLQKLKDQADKAIAQISDEALFAVLDPEANRIALIMKHMQHPARTLEGGRRVEERPDRPC